MSTSSAPSTSSLPATSPGQTASQIPPRKRKKPFVPKVYGYLLDPRDIFEKAKADGTAIDDNMWLTFYDVRVRLAAHCGISINDLVHVYSPHKRDMGLFGLYAVVVASNLCEDHKRVRTKLVEKAKAFLGTEDDPRWLVIYYE